VDGESISMVYRIRNSLICFVFLLLRYLNAYSRMVVDSKSGLGMEGESTHNKHCSEVFDFVTVFSIVFLEHMLHTRRSCH